MRRIVLMPIAVVSTLVALLISPITTYAGGWSVVTLDHTPGTITAGQPFTIGFMVRQHGKTPMDGLSPTVTLTASESGITPVVVRATPSGATGHYAATITLPQTGTWQWTIDAFGPDPAEMSPLTVAAPAAVNSPLTVTQSIQAWAWSIAAILAIGAMALFGTWRSRRVRTA